MTDSISIVLADDHHLVRSGLSALLGTEAGMRVVAEASDGLDVAPLVERLQPDVLILDVMMPGLNGVEVTRQVRQRSPRTCILMLSMYANETYILSALRNGAAGYVLKSASAEILIQAVRVVAGGRRYLCPPLTELAIESYIQKSESASVDAYDSLTGREREVLQLLAEGHSNTKIAGVLAISPRTVESHREKIMQKLDLRSLADLVRFALRRGILPLDT